MRMSFFLVCVLAFGIVTQARAQSLLVQGSGGPTLMDRGYSVAGGVGWRPWSRLTLSLNGGRTHLASTERSDERGVTSRFRGGTLTVAAAEARLSLFPSSRVTPYVLAGYAVGQSRPNVTAAFPERVSNRVRAVFAGGGLHLPVGADSRLRVFGDVRWMVGDEGNELLVVVPLRIGLSWRF